MKKTVLLQAILSLFSCKAQIIPMNDDHVEFSSGAYFMDIENELNKYIGTWKYQNGEESFTIILNKVLHYEYRGYFKDILIGEYKYVDATGTTLVNTLPNMTSTMDALYHNISGASFKRKLEFPKCLDCGDNEFRIKSYFHDPERTYVDAAIIFRWISPTQIKAKIYQNGKPIMVPTEDSPTTTRVPNMEYTLTKQP